MGALQVEGLQGLLVGLGGPHTCSPCAWHRGRARVPPRDGLYERKDPGLMVPSGLSERMSPLSCVLLCWCGSS